MPRRRARRTPAARAARAVRRRRDGAASHARRAELDELVAHGLVERRDGMRARDALASCRSARRCSSAIASTPTDTPRPRVLARRLELPPRGAIPPRPRARWLDLGSGSAFAPLLRPEVAARDRRRRSQPARDALRARSASRCSGISARRRSSRRADLARGHRRRAFDLVTCNAPIPDDTGHADLARRPTSAFFARLLARCRTLRRARRHGRHPRRARARRRSTDLPGERVVVAYTPEDMLGFGVAVVAPDGAGSPRHRRAAR